MQPIHRVDLKNRETETSRQIGPDFLARAKKSLFFFFFSTVFAEETITSHGHWCVRYRLYFFFFPSPLSPLPGWYPPRTKHERRKISIRNESYKKLRATRIVAKRHYLCPPTRPLFIPRDSIFRIINKCYERIRDDLRSIVHARTPCTRADWTSWNWWLEPPLSSSSSSYSSFNTWNHELFE